MRHIEVTAYAQPPCNGEVVVVPVAPVSPASPAGSSGDAPRRLPILGAAPTQVQQWCCQGCGKRWSSEPRPEEAL